MNIAGTGSAVMYDARRRRWWLFQRPLRVVTATRIEEVLDVLQMVEHAVEHGGKFAAGMVAYEAAPAFDTALRVRPAGAIPLAWFGIYDAPAAFRFPVLAEEVSASLDWMPTVTSGEYETAVRRVREYIRGGDTYQVNYTHRLRAAIASNPWTLFVRMIHAQGPGYGAYLDMGDQVVCSASPELFFRLDGGELVSRPMKGTAARSPLPEEDRRGARDLRASEKNRAENIMIVDMVRNDMARIADVGSVRVTRRFAVEQYPTLWQMTSTVRCETRVGLTDIFRALFPAASITGAPKTRTMRIIAELENAPRGVYTGALGFMAPGRTAQFNVAIRTVCVNRCARRAEYGVGGGIVWDSEARSEWAECRAKAAILLRPILLPGLLETLRWDFGVGFRGLEAHLARLQASARYFGIRVRPAYIRKQLETAAQAWSGGGYRVRLTVSRRGIPTIDATPLIPLPEPYRVGLARRPVDARDPCLYHKTLRRTVYEQARAEVSGCEDVLLWNERGEITESCVANVAMEKDGEWITPPVHCGLLPGLERAQALAQGNMREGILRVEDIARARKWKLMNSVRGCWEIVVVK